MVSKMENTREIVLDGLLTSEKELCFSNNLIKDILDKYDYLETRDKAFIKRLFEGCIERRIELDYVLGLFCSVPVKKLKPLIRNLLRMGIYQILYMESVPDSAAINEAVKLSKKRGFAKLSGFVNANLRSVAKNKDDIKWPDKEKDIIKYLSVRYSVPEWLCEKWNDIYGAEETESILKSLLEVHPVTLRFRKNLSENELKEAVSRIAETGAKLYADERLPYIYRAEDVGGITALPGYEEGLFTVQDISSCLAVEAAGIKKGDLVYDACAAPGGKSLLASELTGDSGKVISCDVSDAKVSKIEENISRLNAVNVQACARDARHTEESLKGKVDVLILDVPCSGLGILGKKRDIKYNASPDIIRELVLLQWEIVSACYGYVKPGGRLVYSTCTINPDENENQVMRICNELGFELVGKPVQLLPDRDRCDGFFYAVLEKK